MIEELKDNRYVYHYTSLETLFSILGNYRKMKSEGLIFRASNIFRVNDPTEMELGYEALKKYLPKYEIDRNIPEAQRLSDVYNDVNDETKCKADYRNSIKGNLVEFAQIPYILCFSAKRDYLPMWSLYGKGGNGVCLKFDTYDMIAQNTNCFVGFVSYQCKSISESMERIIDYSYKSAETKNIDEKIKELSNICLIISPFFKYKDYKYEKEFRLVFLKHYGSCINNENLLLNLFKIHLNEVKPYVNLSILPCSLKEIIMGPCMNKDVMYDIIKTEADKCNLNLKVSMSKIPFRLK